MEINEHFTDRANERTRARRARRKASKARRLAAEQVGEVPQAEKEKEIPISSEEPRFAEHPKGCFGGWIKVR